MFDPYIFANGLQPCPTKSNAQRQREFRARHPDYYNARRRKKKAGNATLRAEQAAPPEAKAVTVTTRPPPLQTALPAPTPTLTQQDAPLFATLPVEPRVAGQD